MANEVVGVKIKVDAGDASKELDKVTGSVKKAGTETQKTAQSTENLKQSFQKMPGPLGSVSKGLDSVLQGFKKLIMNPIVLTITLIVGSFVALYKAFTSTKAGGEQVERVMAGLSATMDVLRDRVLKIGGAIIKFFRGDWKEAAEDAKAAFSGFGDEVAAEFNKAAQATKSLQEVEDAVRELGISRAKLNRDLAAAKEIISDETASYQEKKKAINEVRIAEGEQTAKELENARKKLKAQQELNALSDTSREDLQKEADLQAVVFELEQKSAQDKKTLNKQERLIDAEEARIRNEQRQKEQQYEKERQEREEQRRQDFIKNVKELEEQTNAEIELQNFLIENQKKKEQELFDYRVDIAQRSYDKTEETYAFYQELAKKQKDEEQAILDARLAGQLGYANAVGDVFGQLAGLFEQGTAAAKVAALAEIAIGTGTGFINALDIAQKGAKATGPAAPFAFPIFYATQLAAVLGAASKAKNILSSVKGGGGVGGNASAPRIGTNAPISPQIPQASFTELSQQSINQLGSATNRAYVVESDVTNSQERVTRINRAARLA